MPLTHAYAIVPENPFNPVREALDHGEVAQARRLIDGILRSDASSQLTDECTRLRDTTTWPDTWLIAAVRRDPPDSDALDTLAERYWKQLFGRCQLLTLDRQNASDLAQDAWCRVLRARHTLKPDGNFPAYLNAIATNLWRDHNRSAYRAGAMADRRLASLDSAPSGTDDDTLSLGDILPDLSGLEADAQRLLMIDIDNALAQLSPLLREVLMARFLDGESCTEIGHRHNRTEQTVSGWVRQAIREMKFHLEESRLGTPGKENV